MAFVIGDPCIGTKDTACVEVCPVDCIHPKKDEEGFAAASKLFIDPQTCIDCGACVPVCPVQAIYALEELPASQQLLAKADEAWFQDPAKGEALVAQHAAAHPELLSLPPAERAASHGK